MKTAVVVPSNRPERLQEFLDAWAPQFHRPDVRLIVVEDAPEQSSIGMWREVEHYCWADIDEQLGDKASCIPRRSGGIRSFGYLLAGQDESIDMIVSLDDDVRPLSLRGERTFLQAHWDVLEMRRDQRWVNTMEYPAYPRGFPYGVRDVVTSMLNHGLWEGMPDIDAYTQLRVPDSTIQRTDNSALIPATLYYPNCAMNYAFRREVAPLCYFPVLPDGMKRWDDIWSGIIFKHIADLHGWAVTSGYPCVRHERASDPVNNLRQEMMGYSINERLWQAVDQVQAGETPLSTYRKIAQRLGMVFPELVATSAHMLTWAELWDDEEREAA